MDDRPILAFTQGILFIIELPEVKYLYPRGRDRVPISQSHRSSYRTDGTGLEPLFSSDLIIAKFQQLNGHY